MGRYGEIVYLHAGAEGDALGDLFDSVEADPLAGKDHLTRGKVGAVSQGS